MLKKLKIKQITMPTVKKCRSGLILRFRSENRAKTDFRGWLRAHARVRVCVRDFVPFSYF